MDDPIPPSYTEAISRDWLSLVARYLDDSCLCSALRVSRKWYNVLAPQLWRDPAKHFGQDGEGFYAAFTRFLRSLPRVRPEARQLTHMLHLTPVRDDFHGGPHFQWLRDILEYLPNLRCLVVPGIPFFDHSALSVVENHFAIHPKWPEIRKSTFPLRLLVAARCINCTYERLESTLQRFRHLVFLDLSRTLAARDEKVLFAIASLQDLQILKLRGIRLQDDDFETLADPFDAVHIGLPVPHRTFRLRSLDIRDNLLTDKSVGLLISRMILSNPPSYGLQQNRQDIARTRDPIESFRVASQAMQNLRGSDLDKQFVGLLSRTDHADAVLQQLDDDGLTHLYMTGNAITEEGILDLIATNRLHVLDVGDWQDAVQIRHPRLPDHLINRQHDAPITSGTKRIIQSFESNTASSGFTYLRINHKTVTTSAQAETQESFGRDQTVLRLPQTAGGQVRSSSESIISNPHLDLTKQSFDGLPSYEQSNEGTVLPAPSEKSGINVGESNENRNGLGQVSLPSYTAVDTSIKQDISPSSRFEIEQIIDRRQKLRRRIRAGHRGLLPGQLPSLETLVLTSVPRLTRQAQIIQNLKDFIADCATEHYLATEQARLEYSTQNGRKVSKEKFISQRTQQLFALDKIVLEMAPPISRDMTNTDMNSSRSRISKSKSAVEDRDVDVFWEASKDDFSFFNQEEEDLLGRGRLKTITTQNTGSSHSSLSTLGRRETTNINDVHISLEPLREVIAEIAAWRAEKKKRYEAAGGNKPVPEVWPGKIEVLSTSSNNITYDNGDFYLEALR